MEMYRKVAGRWRTILGSSPEEMDVPIKVDEELYFEGKFDTEAMLNMLEKKVLESAGGDYSSIKIRYMAKGQEQAKKYRACTRAGCFGSGITCTGAEDVKIDGARL